MKQVLTLVEHRNGALRDVTFELLTLARQLASPAGGKVTAVLLGHPELAEPLCTSADEVLTIAHHELQDYSLEAYLVALGAVIAERAADVVLLSHSSTGMDLAPALGARLGLPLLTDCLQVSGRGGAVHALRQRYGGKVNARLTLKPAATVLLTVRPGGFAAEPGSAPPAAVQSLAPPAGLLSLGGRRHLRYLEAALEDVDITAAPVLVSVGRGIGKQENMAVVEAFAAAIGATLSCSRPVADKGWLPKSRQVGTSGKVVRPELYLALGISGAYQHVAGMRGAGTIIAVNTDPNAPIFETAHYGIVADLLEVLPLLQKKLKG